jgi:hypothetical protein
MIYKTELINNKNFGTSLDFPNNFKEITMEEFIKSLYNSNIPKYIEYRQIHTNNIAKTDMFDTYFPQKEFVNIIINWYYDNTGIIIFMDSDNELIRYFKCSICNHEYEIIRIGNCLNRYKCKKCNYEQDIDSSD